MPILILWVAAPIHSKRSVSQVAVLEGMTYRVGASTALVENDVVRRVASTQQNTFDFLLPLSWNSNSRNRELWNTIRIFDRSFFIASLGTVLLN